MNFLHLGKAHSTESSQNTNCGGNCSLSKIYSNCSLAQQQHSSNICELMRTIDEQSTQQIYSHGQTRVLLVQQEDSERKLVIKIAPLYETSSSKQLHQNQEFEFLSTLKEQNCKHIINIKNIMRQEQEQICIMQHGCGGNLQAYFPILQNISSKQLPDKLMEFKNILWQTILGLEEIHSMGYVHRDLKPSNLVFSHTGRIKICDFGLVIKAGEIDDSLCGTPQYMPPERLNCKRKKIAVDYSIDMWSLGVLAFELLMGQTPFNYSGNIDDLLNQIYGGYIGLSSQFSNQIRHFIFNLLQTNPTKRLTLQKAKKHKMFQQNFILMPKFNIECECGKNGCVDQQ